MVVVVVKVVNLTQARRGTLFFGWVSGCVFLNSARSRT